MLADAGGRFTDRPFPGRGGAVNRAAGLLLAKIADLIEDPDVTLEGAVSRGARRRPTTSGELLARIDSALPVGQPRARARLGPRAPAPMNTTAYRGWRQLRRCCRSWRRRACAGMIDDLYAELGPVSFTVAWQHDSQGLLAAAVAFLADLRLVRATPGGVLVLPAAARYRNIALALPVRSAVGQQSLAFASGEPDE